MTGQEAIAYIESISWKGSVPGLERTQELLAAMGNPERELKFIHIAGTNGKGSTAAMLAGILQQAGYKTGLFISPFLERFNERIQINGQEIPDEALGEVTSMVQPLADAMADQPTEFELITAVGFEYFRREKCDFVVLEVGMGGRLDSTNVIPAPIVSVITNIGLDHVAFLGDTRAKIAFEKAGIIKAGSRTVLYQQDDEVTDVVRARCEELGVPLSVPDFSDLTVRQDSLTGQEFDYGPWKRLRIVLPGAHQRRNTAVVLTAVQALRSAGCAIPDEAVYAGLAAVRWPGRFEVLHRDPVFIADGGHNLQCVQAVCEALDAYCPGKKVLLILGILADKDYPAMCSLLTARAKRIFTVTPDSPRALSAKELADVLAPSGVPAVVCGAASKAVDAAFAAAEKQDVILSVGSLYMTGEIRRTVLAH